MQLLTTSKSITTSNSYLTLVNFSFAVIALFTYIFMSQGLSIFSSLSFMTNTFMNANQKHFLAFNKDTFSKNFKLEMFSHTPTTMYALVNGNKLKLCNTEKILKRVLATKEKTHLQNFLEQVLRKSLHIASKVSSIVITDKKVSLNGHEIEIDCKDAANYINSIFYEY
ncbi:hypothetical protein NUSPORA_00656 [Nucleospora cyclopteri]